MRISSIITTFLPLLLQAATCIAKGLVYTPTKKSKKILFVTLNAGGHFASYTGVWDGLARRGHDVTVAFPKEADPWFEKARELYENQDLTNLRALHTGEGTVDKAEVDQQIVEVNDKDALSMVKMVINLLGQVMESQLPVLDNFLKDNQVDVIVHDVAAFAAKPICHKHNVPCVTLSVMSNGDSGVMGSWRPPMGMEMHPANPSFLERLLMPMGNVMSRTMSTAMFLKTMHQVDQKQNTTMLTTTLAKHMASTFITACPRSDMTLVTTPPGIDQAQIVDPATVFVGPMRDMERYSPLETDSLELSFLDLAARDEVPVVFMAAGVTAVIREEYVIERLELIRRITKDGNVRVLWANKRGLTEEELAFVPGGSDALLVSKYLPQEAVLHHPAVKVFLTHGGSTSMMEGVAAGVPFLCQPYAFEQVNNCILLQHRGMGVYVEKGAPVEAFVEGVNTLLANQATYATQVLKVWDRVAAFGEGEDAYGARRAVHLIESVANNGADHLYPEICSWPIHQQFHLDTLLCYALLGCLGLWISVLAGKQIWCHLFKKSNTNSKYH